MPYSLRVLVPYYIVSALLALLFGVLKLATFIPCTKCCVRRLFEKIASIKMRQEDYWETAFGWKMLQSVRISLLMDLNRKAHLREEAANPFVFSYDGKTQARLLDYGRENRPLVVNFGSLTCPVFRKRLVEYVQLAREYEYIADFVTVYIEEAHPSDGWMLKNNYVIGQHQSLQERCVAARCLAETIQLQGKLIVDSMENECNISYAALPIRLYIITNGRIQYTGGLGPTFYKPKEVAAWLDSWKNRQPLLEQEENNENSKQQGILTICIQTTEPDHKCCTSSANSTSIYINENIHIIKNKDDVKGNSHNSSN